MQIPLDVLQDLLSRELAFNIWPFFRIAGAFMVAPVFGARLVPMRVRMALTVAATVVIAPLLPAGQPFELSLSTAIVVAQEVVVGIAMGFCLQMIFDALIVAGQTIAMGMGLGLATMIDPQRGISVPVVSQFFVILGLLIFLSLGGHLATVRLLADSFSLLPLGSTPSRDGLWQLVSWGSQMFAGAVRIALPAATALLIANIAFGVMSRAAPTLNLFAVGLPAGLLIGFLLLLLNIGHLSALITELLQATLNGITGMLRA
ncbi:MAG TPA: flagellar biosynthetic protein FliR [Gammaproteobacteria bacterium]|nr:flagellar biosynthetic protein FliR [Gammaproteobacteria bacterium]